MKQVRNEVTHDEKLQAKIVVERPTTTELSGGQFRTEPMFFIQISSVQMIRSIWGCRCRGGSRSIYQSDDTSGAGVNSTGTTPLQSDLISDSSGLGDP
ncbi:hypothetical protein [Bradyrhizobium japonicum]|nr:hypothetical protein [Bradyrhizobium japonicum]